MVSGNGKGYLEQPALHARAPYRAALNTYPGNLRQALKDAVADPKKSLFGVGSGVPSVFYTKVLVSTKPDFLWLDNEHGIFGRLELYE
jgi:4-hydroxy-2-oxoheptanedioate aldolase